LAFAPLFGAHLLSASPSCGRDQMPAFGRAYKAAVLHDVAAFIREELAR
jgi:mono/diheme cytochrome c family protein